MTGMTGRQNYIYGPVPSRRLGRSLGVDIIPYKICSYDCVYCQLGKTTVKTIERKEYIPFKTIKRELDEKTATAIEADYITISGSGEPTLHSRLREIILNIKEHTDIPVAVITNGSLLWDKNVQDSLQYADLVVPSLDAGDAVMFDYVNRPYPEIGFEKMVGGLVSFRQKFNKPVWLEVFLLNGVNALDPEVEKIALLTEKIKPNLVQLNTAARPPAEDFAYRVPDEEMEKLARLFTVKTEVIRQHKGFKKVYGQAATEDVYALIKRRPCSLYDVAKGLGIGHNEALKHLGALLEKEQIHTKAESGETFYVKNDPA